jgi:predicted metal-dependent peptidase
MTAEQRVRGSLLRLRGKSPFLATLALFARFRADPNHPTAATDGREVIYNPEFLASLPPEQVDGVLIHELLHAALLHVTRRGWRDPKGFNIAANIVVNGILTQSGFVLPEGTIHDPELQKYSVEEVYAILQKQAPRDLENPDLLEGESKEGSGSPSKEGSGSPSQAARAKELERHWKEALEQANAVSRGQQRGDVAAGLLRDLDSQKAAQLDWKTLLWRFLTRTPTDFTHFDRRFLYQRQYLEALDSESVRVYACIDTSGSVEDAQMQDFLAELRGIARAYPQAKILVYYADAALYGGFDLEREWLAPIGGGGTDFKPFFAHLAEQNPENSVAVYLTDGYGDFPSQAPNLPVLWVVTAGGLGSQDFVFGEVARLLE